jgi:hypothetical protein
MVMNWQSLPGSVVLVGNGPIRNDWSALVDAADAVIRFNFCEKYGGYSGTKTDILVINNLGKPGLELLVRGLPECGHRAQLVFGRDVGVHFKYHDACGLMNHPASLVSTEAAMIQHFQLSSYESIGAETYDAAFQRLIAIDGKSDFAMPSLGFPVLECLVQSGRYLTLTLIGFTFEGWRYHPWAKERLIAESYQRDGRLKLLE